MNIVRPLINKCGSWKPLWHLIVVDMMWNSTSSNG